jgi:hypothetical protein
MSISQADSAPVRASKVAAVGALIEKVLPYARATDAVARRLVSKVQGLSLCGVASGSWLLYACRQHFELNWPVLVFVGLFILAAPLVLLKQATLLRSIIGLPQRLVETGNRIMGKAQEYRHRATAKDEGQESRKPTLRSLWTASRAMLEVKGITDESREIVALAGSAFLVGNPVFAVVLGIASALTVLVILIGVIVAIALL